MVFLPMTKNLDGDNSKWPLKDAQSQAVRSEVFFSHCCYSVERSIFRETKSKERCERETDFYGFVNAALIFANSFLSLSPIPGGDSCH